MKTLNFAFCLMALAACGDLTTKETLQQPTPGDSTVITIQEPNEYTEVTNSPDQMYLPPTTDAGIPDSAIDAGQIVVVVVETDAGNDAGSNTDSGFRDGGADDGIIDAGSDGGTADAGVADAGSDGGDIDAGHGIPIDSDNDGVPDAVDNCPNSGSQYPEQADQDDDGVGDVCDNCPQDPNPDQTDTDQNHIGDACQWRASDDDGDCMCEGWGHWGGPPGCIGNPACDFTLIGDCDDSNPNIGRRDENRECTLPPADADLDGLMLHDNCPLISNRTQDDRDGDGIGNACDNCPGTPNPDQTDVDQDCKGDACDFNILAHPDIDPFSLPEGSIVVAAFSEALSEINSGWIVRGPVPACVDCAMPTTQFITSPQTGDALVLYTTGTYTGTDGHTHSMEDSRYEALFQYRDFPEEMRGQPAPPLTVYTWFVTHQDPRVYPGAECGYLTGVLHTLNLSYGETIGVGSGKWYRSSNGHLQASFRWIPAPIP